MEESLEVNPDFILTQTQSAASGNPLLVNNSGNVLIQGSSSGGFTISAAGANNTFTIGITVDPTTVRTTLGLGGLAVLNPATDTPNSAVVAGVGYVQADFASVIATLNSLLTQLRSAGIQV